MSQFSIVVPYFGNTRPFEETLASVLRYLPEGVRVIVPHDGTYADPHQLAGAVEYVPVRSGRWTDMWSLILQQLNSTFVCTFWPGIEISEGWDREIVDQMADPQIASVCPRVNFCGPRTLSPREILGVGVDRVGVRQLIQSAGESGRILGPTSYAAAYRVESLSWLPPTEGAVEDVYLDVDLALGLAAVGYHTAVSNWSVACCLSEIYQPTAHGCSASRALIRYQSHFEPAGSPIVADVLALLKGQTWRGGHCMGRFGAKKFHSADRVYRRQLASNRESLASLPKRKVISAPLRRAG